MEVKQIRMKNSIQSVLFEKLQKGGFDYETMHL